MLALLVNECYAWKWFCQQENDSFLLLAPFDATLAKTLWIVRVDSNPEMMRAIKCGVKLNARGCIRSYCWYAGHPATLAAGRIADARTGKYCWTTGTHPFLARLIEQERVRNGIDVAVREHRVCSICGNSRIQDVSVIEQGRDCVNGVIVR